MFGDSKAAQAQAQAQAQALAAEVAVIREALEALRQRCAGLEEQLQAQDPEAARERCERLEAALEAQRRETETLRLETVALSARLDEQAKEARTAAMALLQRLERQRAS